MKHVFLLALVLAGFALPARAAGGIGAKEALRTVGRVSVVACARRVDYKKRTWRRRRRAA